MLRKILAATAVVLALGTVAAPEAEAKTRVHIGVGIGGPWYYGDCDYSLVFDHCYGPRYRYYRPRYYAPRHVDKLSCREARNELRARGYRNIAIRDCNGQYYSFYATRRGRDVRVTMNAYSGDITRIRSH